MLEIYKRRPVLVEVMQWNGINTPEIEVFTGKQANIYKTDGIYRANPIPGEGEVLVINTASGNEAPVYLYIYLHDYIVKYIKYEIKYEAYNQRDFNINFEKVCD